MRTNFTVVSLIFSAVIISGLTSCKKDEMINETKTFKIDKKTLVTPETGPPHGGLGSFVVLDANGNYITAYGGGINFGNTFTYPLNISNDQNGTPYSPFYYGGYSPANMLSFSQNGPHFTMLLGTVVGGMTTNTYEAISAYNTAFNEYINSENPTGSLPQYSSFANQYGGASDGIITINGTFVLDTQSPTNVSVTNLVYNFNTLPTVE